MAARAQFRGIRAELARVARRSLLRQKPDVRGRARRVARVSLLPAFAAKSMWFHVRMDDVSAPWTFH